MKFDLTDGLRDGYYPNEPAGKILFQYIDYILTVEDIKKEKMLRKEVKKL